MKKNVVAIDGPAGAGKSTVAKIVAEKIGAIYIDTGAMYRACAYFALKNEATKDSEIEEIAESINIELKPAAKGLEVIANGENITDAIRTQEVTAIVSKVAALAKVRAAMTQKQQEMAEKGSVVMDGRDICAYVLPKANVKIFLTAAASERAKRRFEELQAKGEQNLDLAKLTEDIIRRDTLDSQREIAPLKQAEDAELIDSTSMTIEEVVAAIVKRCD